MIDTALQKPITYYNLKILGVLKNRENIFIDIFLEKKGIEILVNALEKYESKSR